MHLRLSVHYKKKLLDENETTNHQYEIDLNFFSSPDSLTSLEYDTQSPDKTARPVSGIRFRSVRVNPVR
jgi:hypothetical protein